MYLISITYNYNGVEPTARVLKIKIDKNDAILKILVVKNSKK